VTRRAKLVAVAAAAALFLAAAAALRAKIDLELLPPHTLRGLPARSRVAHSGRARVFGRALPFRGFADHDWVLIAGTDPLYVDPAFADAWLGWDISRNVVSPPE
jgi:hypothetical protein